MYTIKSSKIFYYLPEIFDELLQADSVENKDAGIVVELPFTGLDRDQIDVTVTDSVITIKTVNDEKNKKYFFNFEKKYKIPTYVDSTKIVADYTNGLLKVTFPVSEKAKPVKIEVK